VIKHIFYLLDEDVLFYFYAPANFPRLAVLNARVVLICGTSEHCLSPSHKARSR